MIKAKSWPNHYTGSSKSIIERNDCVVRSITETFNIPYDEAHLIAETKFRRKAQRGTHFAYPKFKELQKSGYKINNYEIESVPPEELTYYGSVNQIGLFDGKKEKFRITVGMFLKQKPLGRYIVFVKGHAFSVINGVIIGNAEDGEKLKARVYNVIIAVENKY